MRVQSTDRVGRALGLRPADVVGPVQDLAVQVGQRDHVVVDDPERPDARAGQILQRRRAEAARPHDEDPRRLQPGLSRAADAVQHDLAGIAFDFFARKGHGPKSTRLAAAREASRRERAARERRAALLEGRRPAAQGARDARPPAPDASGGFWQAFHVFNRLNAQK